MSSRATIKATGKAVCIHSFGGVDVLQFEDIQTPEPAVGQLLIRIHSAGVNPVDWKIREGYMGKLPLPAVLGRDFSGIVEAVGAGVAEFQIGEEVFGEVASGSGSYAEYAIATESQTARKPASLDHAQAAALPVASLTAWQALFDTAGLQTGQKVLIHAASGGVGSFAVQFAKLAGAHVIGTTSARNIDFVRRLGADEVIDYQATRFEDVIQDMDVVFDTVGGETQERSWRVLKQGGILVSIVQPPAQDKPQTHGVRGLFIRQDPRGDQMAKIADLVVRGQVQVHIEKVLPLGEARKAQELSQSGHVRGKIVLRVD